jgi:hypothetical protein
MTLIRGDFMKRSILSLILVLWSVSYTSGQQQKPLNIAIIADKAGGLGQSPIISLLEVQLSRNDNIRLLERAQIDKILQEQQLSAAGLLDRNNTIKIGQLLRADALVIITLENEVKTITTGSIRSTAPVSTETGGLDESGSKTENQATGDLIRVRVAEAAHGLRLLDRFEQLDSLKLNEIAERINNSIKKAVDKLLLPTGQLIPVGIVDIHRVQLGERYTMLERALPKLLSIRLGLEPKIVMLEREDLKILLDEKLRTQGEDSKFWASAVLIEGNLQPKNGGLEMSLSLRRPAGEKAKSFTIPVKPNEPSSAIDKAATNIVQNILNTLPSSHWQLAQEAEQFYQQGQMLASHSRFDDALALYETAHTLQPQNAYYTGAVFERIWDLHKKNERIVSENESIRKAIANAKNAQTVSSLSARIVEPNICPYSDLEIVEMVSILVKQIHDGYIKGLLSTHEIYYNWSGSLGCELIRSESYFASLFSVSTEQIKLINRENRKIWFETFSNALHSGLIDSSYPPMNNTIAVRLAWLSSDDPNELIANLKKAFTEYVMPPDMGGRLGLISQRKYVFNGAFANTIYFSSEYLKRNTYLKGSGDIVANKWKEYFRGLVDINDPVVSNGSQSVLENVLRKETTSTRTEDTIYISIKKLLEELKNYDEFKNNQSKHEILTQIKKTILSQEVGLSDKMKFWEDMCNILIEEKDLESLAFLDPGWRPFVRIRIPTDSIEVRKNVNLRFYSLLEQIAEVLKNSTNKQSITALTNIKDYQAEIRRNYPNVEVPQKISIFPVTMLLTQKDWPQQINFSNYVMQVILQDKMLWIAMTSWETSDRRDNMGNINWQVDIGLVGVDLQLQKLFALWQVKIPSPYNVGKCIGLSSNNETSYISIENIGIVEFPGNVVEGREYIDKPKVYTNKNGLPSITITSIAQDNDKIWVAYGGSGQESGLGLYDPKSKKWDPVFCSTLKGEHPLDAGNPYQLIGLTYVPPDRLFFVLSNPARNVDIAKWTGIWKLNTDIRDIKYLGPYCKYAVNETIEHLEKKIVLKVTGSLTEFDSISERIKINFGDIPLLLKEFSDRHFPPPDYDTDLLSSVLIREIKFGPNKLPGNIDLTFGSLHEGKLWTRLGQSQIIIADKGKSYEEAQIIDNNILDGQPVEKFVSTPYGLIAIGEGTVGLIDMQ